MRIMQFRLNKSASNLLKIAAALMVMLHHYSQHMVSNGISNSLFYKLLSSQGGYLGVAIFFFLSGYGLMESEQKNHLDFFPFFRKRIFKVYLPVILVTLIWFFLSPLFLSTSPFDNHETSFWGWSHSLFSTFYTLRFGDEVLWFIKIILILYVGFFFFTLIWRKNKIFGVIYLSLFTFAASAFQAIYSSYFSAISIPFFSLGVAIAVLKDNPWKMALFSILILSSISVLSFIFLDHALFIHSMINIISITLLIVFFSIFYFPIEIPAILGALSFDIYLVHNKILMCLKDHSNFFSIYLFLFLTTIFTLIFYFTRSFLLEKKENSIRELLISPIKSFLSKGV